jgi:hypothetical protein
MGEGRVNARNNFSKEKIKSRVSLHFLFYEAMCVYDSPNCYMIFVIIFTRWGSGSIRRPSIKNGDKFLAEIILLLYICTHILYTGQWRNFAFPNEIIRNCLITRLHAH